MAMDMQLWHNTRHGRIGKGTGVAQTRGLEAFLAVADLASVTAAASRLGLTQPGLSRQIQKLEQEVGVLLFTRSRGGLRLTPAGERFRAYAEDVIDRHRNLMADLRGETAALVGELAIVASTTPGEFVVPRRVAEFTAIHPDVRATVSIMDSRQAIEQLLERTCELAFVGAEVERKGLRFDAIAEDEIVLAVPASHILARRPDVPLAALENQRFIEREDGSGTILSVRRALAEHGAELPSYRVAMTLTTTRSIVSAVRAGYGIGFVSFLALAGIDGHGMAAIRIAGHVLSRSLYIVRDERRVLSQVAQRFADLVLERAAARA
jgi:DNA-binding transcriptional LysR family regulator